MLSYYAVNVLKKRFSSVFSSNDPKKPIFLNLPVACVQKRPIMRAMPRGAAKTQSPGGLERKLKIFKKTLDRLS
jgi:hypothetical protein|tara:strand:+ start:26 stop:247 length:222 start_codon:yes stop_codon:yes gene_type:complete